MVKNPKTGEVEFDMHAGNSTNNSTSYYNL
jgi:hypothetical protein